VTNAEGLLIDENECLAQPTLYHTVTVRLYRKW